jgi:hypothetical protein
MPFLEDAKAAGEEAARDAFGLLSRTSKPPPTWAHGRKVTIPSMAQVPQQHSKEPPK